MLNPAGTDAQFERLRCAISRGILRNFPRIWGYADKLTVDEVSRWRADTPPLSYALEIEQMFLYNGLAVFALKEQNG